MLMVWGAQNVGILADTRFLTPGFDTGAAGLTAIGVYVSDVVTAARMRVRHNTTTGETNAITYRLRKNGANTLLFVSLAPNVAEGSNLNDEIDLASGDLIEVIATKSGILLNGALNPTVSIELL